MSLLVELPLALLLGILLFAMLPMLSRGRLSDWFISLAMSSMGRAILLKRSNGGYSLKESSYNSANDTEEITVGGETYQFQDEYNRMSRFKKRAFGLAHEKRGVIISPRDADMGRALHRHKRDGTYFDEKGRQRKYFPLKQGRTLVDLGHALHAIQGSAPPTLASTVDEYVKKGQQSFNSSRALTYTIWLMMFGAGAGTPWLLLKLKDSAGGSSLPGVPVGQLIVDLGVLL